MAEGQKKQPGTAKSATAAEQAAQIAGDSGETGVDEPTPIEQLAEHDAAIDSLAGRADAFEKRLAVVEDHFEELSVDTENRLKVLEQPTPPTGSDTSDVAGGGELSLEELAARIDLGAARLDGVVTAIERALGLAIRHTLPGEGGPVGAQIHVTGAESLGG